MKIAPDSSGEIGRLNDQVVANGMLGEFVDRVFDGSAEAVVLSRFNASVLDADSIKRLRRLLDQYYRNEIWFLRLHFEGKIMDR